MAYVPTKTADFVFKDEPYQPSLDFTFYPQPGYAFIPPPTVVTSNGFGWSIGQGQNRHQHSRFGKTRKIEISHRQRCQQANVLEDPKISPFWNQAARFEHRVTICHGIGQARTGERGSRWTQPPPKQRQQQSQWDNILQQRDDTTSERWNQAPPQDQGNTARFDRVDEFGATSQRTVQGYKPPAASLLNFLFDGRQYTPAITPSVYFKLGNQPPDTSIQPRDSQRQSLYSSSQNQDGVIRLPWGFGRKAKDEDVTSNYGGETEPEDHRTTGQHSRIGGHTGKRQRHPKHPAKIPSKPVAVGHRHHGQSHSCRTGHQPKRQLATGAGIQCRLCFGHPRRSCRQRKKNRRSRQ